jgi:hypothetical protein
MANIWYDILFEQAQNAFEWLNTGVGILFGLPGLDVFSGCKSDVLLLQWLTNQ